VSFAVGSLVKARGREWMVLPDSTDQLLLLRPLGGTDAEIAGVLAELETVQPARFALPDPDQPGDYRSARLLRDALRLGFRSSAGPFRSFGHLAVEPRPYQLVPLLLALRRDPIRVLIADDVGIGKTIEALLIAREMLDSGEAANLAVLCPPHLAEQWQREMSSKFNLDAELVLPSTAARLERDCAVGQTLFQMHPIVVVSTDYIKADRRRNDFLRTCPKLVIVDEAHTCAADPNIRGTRHQRHELLAGLAKDPQRHLILVTATPHSGKAQAFRSLLALLDPSFGELPDDLTGPAHESDRRRLAQYFVQRRRGDIQSYLDTETPFPKREDREEGYQLTAEYRLLFDRVLKFAREVVLDTSGGRHRQRVRWWSALALLRSLASSPAAAEATLRTRATTADTETPLQADALGARLVLDQAESEDDSPVDVAPGSDYETDDGPVRRRLLEMAREANRLRGKGDAKVEKAANLVAELIRDGYNPIVFCRFIPTAEYVAEELRSRLPRDVEIAAVTGQLPPDEREVRVSALGKAARRVLVATDCLSEGINLQDHFDAVLHYDLSWNPTRHEQREGRVDRFGQPRSTVRVISFFGRDNDIDYIVLNVLLRKHREIRRATGVSVPVPGNPSEIMEALVEGLLLRGRGAPVGDQMVLYEEYLQPQQQMLFTDWEEDAEREKRSRTMFAQESIKVDEVSREMEAVNRSVGKGTDIASFVRTAVGAAGGTASGDKVLEVNLTEAKSSLREAVGADRLRLRLEGPTTGDERLISRTDPIIEAIASYVLNASLDPVEAGPAARCGVIRTADVRRRTTLILLRHRIHLVAIRDGIERPMLAEDCSSVAFEGGPDAPRWLEDDEVEPLLHARPSGNTDPAQASAILRELINQFDQVRSHLDDEAKQRATDLLETHRRVRHGAGISAGRLRVEAQVPPDVLGIYAFIPQPASNH